MATLLKMYLLWIFQSSILESKLIEKNETPITRTAEAYRRLDCCKVQLLHQLCHMLRWLDNFDEGDQDRAIDIFSKLRYYSHDDILKNLSDSIDAIKSGGKFRCVFLSIGSSGKSGDGVLYFIEQIKKRSELYSNTLSQALGLMRKHNGVLVFVDDIIGTGTTFCNWLHRELTEVVDTDAEYLSSLIEDDHVKLLCIAASTKGIGKVKSQFPKISIYCDVMNKSFMHSGSEFGGSVSMLRYREMSYKYGSELEPYMPLGFQNNQLLVVFNHAVPNNTLPIIWSDNSYKGKKWFPLFPRTTVTRIERVTESKKDLHHQLILLHDLFGYDEITKELFKTTNLQLLSMVKMLKNNTDEFTIAHSLGITCKQADTLWQEGINRNLWDKEHRLTEGCLKAYDEKKKLITIQRTRQRERELSESALTDGEKIYLPETFRGVK